MQIVSLLNGENINQDHQLTTLAKATINAWVISGLQVSAGSVAVGEAFIECTRSNGEKIMVLFQNTSPLSIDTSGNGKIFIEIAQENIDNGVLNAEDGSNIGKIKKASAYPVKNYIPLASVASGQITDDRRWMRRKMLLSNTQKAPKMYFSRSGEFFETAEFCEKTSIGLGTSANNYHNVYTSGDSTFCTQVAYSDNEMYLRCSAGSENWKPWQKIFPFSIQGLDLQSLSEVSNYSSVYDTIPVIIWWQNKKVTVENFRKWMTLVNTNTQILHNNWASIYLPHGGMVSVVVSTINSPHNGNIDLKKSTNNSEWSTVCGFSMSPYDIRTGTFLIPAGNFVKISGNIDSAKVSATVQIF